MEQDDELLHSVAAQYGVQPRFLVALWGVESDFGHHTGDTPAVAALATLGWRGRRGDYFRRELIALLTTVESGYVDPAALYGSWAGALGQCQFMPSNFKRFAVDYDGDGARDIWTSTGDVLASMSATLGCLWAVLDNFFAPRNPQASPGGTLVRSNGVARGASSEPNRPQEANIEPEATKVDPSWSRNAILERFLVDFRLISG